MLKLGIECCKLSCFEFWCWILYHRNNFPKSWCFYLFRVFCPNVPDDFTPFGTTYTTTRIWVCSMRRTLVWWKREQIGTISQSFTQFTFIRMQIIKWSIFVCRNKLILEYICWCVVTWLCVIVHVSLGLFCSWKK